MALIGCTDSDYSIGASKSFDNKIVVYINTEWSTQAACIFLNTETAKELLLGLNSPPKDFKIIKFKSDYNSLELQSFTQNRFYIQIDKGCFGATAFVLLNSEGLSQLAEELKKAINEGN